MGLVDPGRGPGGSQRGEGTCSCWKNWPSARAAAMSC